MNLTPTRLLSVLMLTATVIGCATPGPERHDYLPTAPEVAPASSANGAIYQPGWEIALFEDIKARHVGDTLTILLVERTDASKSSSTSTSKETQVAIENPTLFGRELTIAGEPAFSTSIQGTQSFDGGAESTQSNRLQGSVSVTVAKRLANGNLLVRGEKWITLNQGREFVQISGIVRPVDISADNTVLSDRIADAHIRYSGKGPVADASKMGFLARFFNSAWLPF